MTEISPATKKICNENYKSNCARCPIRPACVQSVGPGREALDRWQAEVNAAAEAVNGLR